MVLLIGLMGPISAGKDTSANYIKNKYKNKNVIIRHLAYPLKKACQELFLFADEQLYDEKLKQTPDQNWFGCTPRRALQYIGTNLLRDNLNTIMPGLDKNIFTHSFKIWYNKINNSDNNLNNLNNMNNMNNMINMNNAFNFKK